MSPFIQLPVVSETPTHRTATDSEQRERLYLAFVIALSVTTGLLLLFGLAFTLLRGRCKGRFTTREAMMHRDILNLRKSVYSLERQLDCCTCTKRLPWEGGQQPRGVLNSERHTIRFADGGEWVEFSAGDQGASNPYAAEEGLVGRAVTTDARGEQTPSPPSDRKLSPGSTELQSLNRSRVRYLQTLREVDERFAVGDDSDDDRESLPPRPENPLSRSTPASTSSADHVPSRKLA